MQILKSINKSNFGKSRDDQTWRISIKRWLVDQDSALLDLSFMKKMLQSVISQSGFELKDSEKPSEHYKLCSNAVNYGTNRFQKYYIGYEPKKNKSFPYICVEYTSDRKQINRSLIYSIRMIAVRNRKYLDELIEDLVALPQ